MRTVSFSRLAATLSACMLFTFCLSAAHAGVALWIAESEGALKIAGETGEIVFEIPEAGGVEGIAVDDDNGRVWTFGDDKHQRWLKAYDGDGHLQVDVSTPQIHKQTRLGEMLADADGVWLAAGRDLYRYDMQGQLQKHMRFRRDVTAMTLDSERAHLWVAVADHVFIVDRNGEDVDRFWTLLPLITRLDYDQHEDGVWLVVGPYLLRLNAEDRALEFVSRFGVGFKLWRHLSADGQGGVWGADPLTLSHVNAAGEVEFSFKSFNDYHGQKTLQDLAADPEDGAVWVANKTTLKKYSVVGALQRELTPDLGDGVIRSINRMALTAQSQPPTIVIDFPAGNGFVSTNTPALELHYSSEGVIDTESIGITHDDSPLSANCSATQTEAVCTLLSALPEGEITLAATVTDTEGNLSEPARVTFTVDTLAPVITLTDPADGLITNSVQLAVSGNLSETAESLTLIHNGDGIGLQADDNNVFSHNVTLSEGDNTIAVSAVDFAGNAGEVAVNVTLDTVVPVIPDLGLIEIVRPDDEGNVMIVGRTGSVEPNSRIAITNTRTSESIIVTAGADGAFTANIAGAVGDDIQITAADAAGNASEPARAPVTYLPPDPSVIAPPMNPTQTTPLSDATAFLYTGSNPIQTGVPSGTIEAGRVAVIRGRVLDKQNHPLPGVIVNVKDHPEFGQTLSRADGRFDLAVNGGGILTLNYQKDNYLPVQRKVNAPWRDYVFADDVVMIQLDPQVTTVDLTSTEIQVARGTPQTDEDGVRQATLLFPAGTVASMTLPDGTVHNLTTLSVRATEYTVGDNGFEAMPGELPPASGYTYAVELSIDEALAVNAKRVNFNQPIPFYVDNFLNFPVGEAVPIGYYDREQAVWKPSDNGRIVEILSIDNGLATLDVNGSGSPAAAAQLAELGVTDAERQQLAALYSPGKSLWRTLIPHFTPWDCNWPYGPPEDAVPPPESDDPPLPNVECTQPGCTIGAQTQTLGEEIPIIGTPFSLHYQSDRVPGRKDKSSVTLTVSGPSVPASLQTIRLSIWIAGQGIVRSFGPAPNQRYTFEWNGLDGFGREVHGSATANIAVTYIYPCVYRPGNRGFGYRSPSIEAIGTRDNCQSMKFLRRSSVDLESPFMPPIAMAGQWSLNIQHAWQGGTLSRLIQGNGGYRTLRSGIHTVAGDGTQSFAGDDGLAIEAFVNRPRDVTMDAAGNLYIDDWFNLRIRRVDTAGIITTVAGTGSWGFAGDGGPAIQAQFRAPSSVAIDTAGNLYIVDQDNHRIRRVGSDGIIVTVAGSGETWQFGGGFAGDGGPATEALLHQPRDLAVDDAGNLYIADRNNHRIRQVSPDGIINTVAGSGPAGGEGGFAGDSGAATSARLNSPSGIAVDATGNLYIADTFNHRIRKVGVDGVIVTIAGTGSPGFSGDGGPATQAQLWAPTGLDVDAEGNVYVADRINHRIRKISPDGIITTVAGSTATGGFSGDGGPGPQAALNAPDNVAVDPAGNLYIVDTQNSRIRRLLTRDLFDIDQTTVASENGRQLFIFDRGGRHLRTINTLTGVTEYEFGRDSEGRLISITDVDGDVTVIERDAGGRATAIVAPDGQRIELTIDENGHLIAVTNPAGET
ncbi:MAG TPA: Ig-like domain-containing protein, partial [Gammaproteobacteria bacterium]